MNPPLLLDTHIVLWLDSGDHRLRPSTRNLIEETWRLGGNLQISAVSGWEIACLFDRGHIELDLAPEQWLSRFAARPGIAMLPLECQIAARAYSFPGFNGRDPADRLLIATAVATGSALVTYDRQITQFARRYGKTQGFQVLT